MSKKIPEIREQIFAFARKDLMEKGYAALSMRSLAERCGIAVGTLYNYYRSKDDLIARIILEDWSGCIEQMNLFSQEPRGLTEGLMGLCSVLENFTNRYRTIWAQHDGRGAVEYVTRFHLTIRQKLAEPIRRVICASGREELSVLAPVLAETMLACAMNPDLGEKSFGALAGALEAGT